MPYPGEIPYPAVKTAPNAGGRPKKVQPLMVPMPDSASGFEMNADLDILKATEKKYLKSKTMPPNLQPKPLVNDASRVIKNKNISQGWKRPRQLGM